MDSIFDMLLTDAVFAKYSNLPKTTTFGSAEDKVVTNTYDGLIRLDNGRYATTGDEAVMLCAQL